MKQKGKGQMRQDEIYRAYEEIRTNMNIKIEAEQAKIPWLDVKYKINTYDTREEEITKDRELV